VGLVDKLLVLMPKLRQARSASERQTLQNAATAAEQQIDALVYDSLRPDRKRNQTCGGRRSMTVITSDGNARRGAGRRGHISRVAGNPICATKTALWVAAGR